MRKKSFLLLLSFFFLLISLAQAQQEDFQDMQEESADFSSLLSSDTKTLKEKLKNDPSILESSNEKSQTLLMQALKQNSSKETIKTILQAKPDLMRQDRHGKTALMYASQFNTDEKVVKMVLKKKSFLGFGLKKKVKQKDDIELNSYDYSRVNENPKVAKLLKKYIKKKDVSALSDEQIKQKIAMQEEQDNASKKQEKHSFWDDISRGIEDEYEMGRLKSYNKTYLFDFSDVEATALNEPPEDEYIQNPNTKDINGITFLMVAAKVGQEKLAKKLIHSGANVNAQDKNGWTSLMYACRYCPDEQIAQMLVEAGANVFLKNNFGATALQFAINYNDNAKVVQEVLNEYDIEKDNCTDFFFMAIRAAKDADKKVQCFIDKGQSVNSPQNGKTPLMVACQDAKSISVVKVLQDAGANPHIQDLNGLCAFDYAKKNANLVHDETYWKLNMGH